MNAIRLSRSDINVLAVCIILGGILTVVAQFIVLARSEDQRADQYGEEVFTRSVAIAADGTAVIQQLNESANILCSEDDLAMMRELAFRLESLGDVGRVEDGALICSAMWGDFTPARKLPQVMREDRLNGTDFWRKTVGLLPIDEPVDVAAKGRVAVFTDPAAFEAIEPNREEFGALVLTHDGDYVFQSFGETSGLRARFGQPSGGAWFTHDHYYSRCSDIYDICLIARYSPSPLGRENAFQFAVFLFAGAVGGGGIGGFALWYHNHRLSWRQKLKTAIKTDRLAVVYQPICDLDSAELTGAEALVRMIDETDRWIYPDVFIAAVEEMGLGNVITRRVAAMALSSMQSVLQARPDLYISINVVASDLLDPGFLAFMHNETASRGLSPQQVALELTERSTANHEALTGAMARFRDCGYRIYIDDFGTGYSSLSYISALPVSGIKIDRMFIKALDQDTVGSTIVNKIFDLVSTLNVMVICEGVETVAQADRLKALRSGLSVQGWLFGKPVSAKEFVTQFLEKDVRDATPPGQGSSSVR